MNEYLYNWGLLLLTVAMVMLPICLILGLASAIIDCIWPEGGENANK